MNFSCTYLVKCSSKWKYKLITFLSDAMSDDISAIRRHLLRIWVAWFFVLIKQQEPTLVHPRVLSCMVEICEVDKFVLNWKASNQRRKMMSPFSNLNPMWIGLKMTNKFLQRYLAPLSLILPFLARVPWRLLFQHCQVWALDSLWKSWPPS